MRWLPLLRMRYPHLLPEPLAAIISLEALQNALHVLGYPAVTLFIMIESAGVPFPGETMLLLASVLSTFVPLCFSFTTCVVAVAVSVAPLPYVTDTVPSRGGFAFE